jgi:hypothetical protein
MPAPGALRARNACESLLLQSELWTITRKPETSAFLLVRNSKKIKEVALKSDGNHETSDNRMGRRPGPAQIVVDFDSG